MSLLDDNLIESAFDEKEMRKNYRPNWLEKHSGLGMPGVERIKQRIFTKNGSCEYHIDNVNINKKFKDGGIHTEHMPILELDCYYRSNSVAIEEVTQLNTSNIFNIKPDPNHRYIMTNVTDSDLSLFEIRTRDKQGGVLYCINCTRKIAEKSRKWKYKFLEYDVTTGAYFIVEER